MSSSLIATHAALLALALPAALCDARTGSIPNRLTLPALALAPLVRGFCDGPGALGASLAGGLVCGLVPLLLFRVRAMGGGDVKLLAASGAIAGAALGLELQWASFVSCAVYGLARSMWRRELGTTLRGAVAVMRWESSGTGSNTLEEGAVRFGPFVCLAAIGGLARALSGVAW